MDLNDYNREFFYGGHAVGLLHDVDRDHPGDWHYHPYRGPGHYDMATDLIAGKQAECYFDQGNERTRFTVVSRPPLRRAKSHLGFDRAPFPRFLISS